MDVKFEKTYVKQYQRLPVKTRQKADQRVALLLSGKLGKQLNDHALTGKCQGYRSINITGDIRALYYQRGNTLVIFAFIGSHSQLYG
jgi:addiction module RelE/StbE family toxin